MGRLCEVGGNRLMYSITRQLLAGMPLDKVLKDETPNTVKYVLKWLKRDLDQYESGDAVYREIKSEIDNSNDIFEIKHLCDELDSFQADHDRTLMLETNIALGESMLNWGA